MKLRLVGLLLLAAFVVPANAEIISEFQSNPAGMDPALQTIELSGTAGMAFTDWTIFTIDSDVSSGAFIGTLDRLTTFSGQFDANGLFTVDVLDLENPSFILALSTSGFTASLDDDLDTDGDGLIDAAALASLGNVTDAIEISDNTGDADANYTTQLIGSEVSFAGDEPELVFREGSTGQFFAVNVDQITDLDGNLYDVSDFDIDPLSTTFGAFNPTLITAIPEPSSIALLGVISIGCMVQRRRRT